jgi:hypothetical protein
MTSSQANPAYSTTSEFANPANPITAPGGTTYDEPKPKEKLSFAERHKAPTTKDVETNKWGFGAQQVVSGPGDHSADNASTDLGGLGPAGDGGNFTAGTAAGGTNDMGVGGGQERYGDQNGGVDKYERNGRSDVVGGDAFSGPTGGAGFVGDRNGGETGYEGTRPVGSTAGVYEGRTGDGNTASGTGTGTGAGYDNTTGTGTGVNDDEYEDDGAGGKKKKKNPLKKVIEAVKNI